MTGTMETRLRKLEATERPVGFSPVERIIADPEQDAWANTDEGIAAEIERRRATGELPPQGLVIVRRIVSPPARDQLQ
jgi:hypothetical protein